MAKLAERTVYRLRGQTYHADTNCVKGRLEELSLEQALAWKWRACLKCAFLPLLAEAAREKEPTYLWAYTWPVGEDAESWQQNERKRRSEAELLARAGRILAMNEGRSQDQLETEIWGSAPALACSILSGNFPLIGGPSDGHAPSDEALEVFKTLYRDDDSPYRLDGQSIKRRDDLWKMAEAVTG